MAHLARCRVEDSVPKNGRGVVISAHVKFSAESFDFYVLHVRLHVDSKYIDYIYIYMCSCKDLKMHRCIHGYMYRCKAVKLYACTEIKM